MQMRRGVDADVAGEKRILERLERLVVELAPDEHPDKRAGELGARQPEARLQPLGPGAATRPAGASSAGFFLKRSNNGGIGREAARTAAKLTNSTGSLEPPPTCPLRPPNACASSAGAFAAASIRFPTAAGVRPTPDRVRETLFNWLGQDLTGLATPRPVCRQRRADARGAVARRGASGRGRPRPEARRVPRARRRATSARRGSRRMRPTPEHGSPPSVARFDVIFLDPPFARRSVAVAPARLRGPACARRLRLRRGAPASSHPRCRWPPTGTRGPGRCIIICCATTPSP